MLGEDDNFLTFFESYLREIHSESIICKVKFDTNNGIEIHSMDAVFFLTHDPELFEGAQQILIQKGINPLQIYSPSVAFFPALAEKRGFILSPDRKRCQFPVLATIDTVNACQLNCATCNKPYWQENNERMDFGLFKKILDKLQTLGIKAVELYNYTEPFLNPELYRFAKEVKSRGLVLGISTNLSLPNIPHLKECVDLLEKNDWFVISTSGMSQDIYSVNHIGGNLEYVKRNIEEISKSSKSHLVHLRHLLFDYNDAEVLKAKKLADKNNISFHVHPAQGDPLSPYERRQEKEQLLNAGLSYDDYERSYNGEGIYCPFIHSRNVVINHKGNMELCCIHTMRPYDLGSFLDQDFAVMQLKRDMYPYCISCPSRARGLRQGFPVDRKKAAYLMTHAMKTMQILRQFAPENFSDNISNSMDFATKSAQYFVTKKK